MYIPREFIRELIDRADIAEIVGAHVKLERRGVNWFGLCPFHAEKTPSFSVNPSKGFYHCFGCGAHGNAVDFLAHIHGGEFLAAVRALAAIQGVRVPETRQESDSAPDLGGVLRAAVEHWKKRLKETPEAVEYLKQRGVSGETAKRYELGYAADSWDDLTAALAKTSRSQAIAAGVVREKNGKLYDYFRHRVIFPIAEADGRLCGFGARVIRPDDEPKYLNSAENAKFSKRRVLYGLPQAQTAARQKKRLLVCEGYMDVVALAQAGFEESVAAMGTAATAEQMRKALRIAPTVIFAFDADSAGQKGALRALEGVLPALKDGASVLFLFMPPGEDPDSFVRRHGPAAFEERIAAAKPLADFMADALWGAAAVADEDGKRAAMLREGERLLRLLSPKDAPYWRQLLTERLSARAGVDAAPIRRAVSKSPPSRRAGSARRLGAADNLLLLLYCLTVDPSLISRLEGEEEGGLPLPGAPEDAAIVAAVLSKLRWSMEEEPATVPTLLENEGYPVLARQVREVVKMRYSDSSDIAAEMDAVVAALRKSHRRRAGAGKRDWLAKMEAKK